MCLVAYRLLMLNGIIHYVIIMILYYVISKNNTHARMDWIKDKLLRPEKWIRLHNKLSHIWKRKSSPTLLLKAIPFNPLAGTSQGDFFPSSVQHVDLISRGEQSLGDTADLRLMGDTVFQMEETKILETRKCTGSKRISRAVVRSNPLPHLRKARETGNHLKISEVFMFAFAP